MPLAAVLSETLLDCALSVTGSGMDVAAAEFLLAELFPPSSAFLSAVERIMAAESIPEIERASP